MYHPHADEMVQMAMGMMGFFIVHPRDPEPHAVDRDFVFLLELRHRTRQPRCRITAMTDFNLWTFNSRAFPGIDPLVVRKGDRVRIRVGNLTMTNHPIHLHGYEFEVTGTDGGWVPAERALAGGHGRHCRSARCAPSSSSPTTPGDWALHCHKSHHTMNAMGHDVPNMIGVDQKRCRRRRSASSCPDYMAMGEHGMAEMGAMEMPLPENTLPMMTGEGPFGPIEMGGMFTVLKVREGLAARRLHGPRLVQHPKGTVAHEWKADPGKQPRRRQPRQQPPPMSKSAS